MAFLIPENLRTRTDVAVGVNRTARVLHQALSDAATVWYEPLFDRRGDRPDLVALVPDVGVLVVEVLEEKAGAIRGVRNGRLLLRKSGTDQEADDPLSRAEVFAARLCGLLDTEPRLAPDERLPVVALGVFPYLGREESTRLRLGEVVDLRRCLFRDECEAGLADPDDFERRLLAVFGGTLRDPLTAEAVRVYRALIHPDTVIGAPQLPFPTATPEEEFKVLDRRQEAVAKGLGEGHRVIRGVAGSGKTLVLTYRARLLAEAFPQQRVLVTCFNRTLAASLRRQLPLDNVAVRTIEALMQKARIAVGMPELTYDDTTMEERAEAALEALDRAPRAVGQLFDHVMVDEAQDFATPALGFAVRLLKPGSDSLLVVADAAQNIYSNRFRWKDAGINAVGRTRVLDTSYRNTREILEFAHDFLMAGGEFRVDGDADSEDETALVPPRFSTRSGPLPLTARADSPLDEVLFIARHCRELLDRGVEPGSIAVLYGSRTTGGFWWPDTIRKVFAEADLRVFWATDPDNWSQRDRIGDDRSEIVLSTIHSAKGLEFAHVILCGWLDDKPLEQSMLNRRLVYVGMTRATQELVVTFSGQHQYIADLER